MNAFLSCSVCGYENTINLKALETWPVFGVLKIAGYICQNCQRREPVYYTTDSLEESLRKLNRIKPHSANFKMRFAKVMRKFDAIQKRGEMHGAHQDNYETSSGSMG